MGDVYGGLGTLMVALGDIRGGLGVPKMVLKALKASWEHLRWLKGVHGDIWGGLRTPTVILGSLGDI